MPIINARPGGLVFVQIDVPKVVPETILNEPPCEIVRRVVFRGELIDAGMPPVDGGDIPARIADIRPCEHKDTRFDPKGWPTGEDLEICNVCGMSRTHWEQGESSWEMVDDIDAARAEIESFLIVDAEVSTNEQATMAMEWRKSAPTVDDLRGSPEEFFWVRGGNFNRMVMARANIGINSEKSEGRRRYFVDINFSFFAAGIPPCIWSQDLSNWPGFGSLEWAGPVHRPATIIELKK